MDDNLSLIHYSASGFAWLIFFVGLVYYSHFLWRTNGYKLCITTIICSILSLLGAGVLVAGVTMIIANSLPSFTIDIDHDLISKIALVCLTSSGISWVIAALSFMIAVLKIKKFHTPPETTHPRG